MVESRFEHLPAERSRALSDVETEIYSRQIVLKDIGYEGQLKLKWSKVAVVGLGGLGCPAALQLAAMGVGHIRLVDRDVVELSNLHRQYLYGVGDVGFPKVEVAARYLTKLNPELDVEPLPWTVHTDNALEAVDEVDVVVDGLDSVEARYSLNRACQRLGVSYVYAAAIEAFGNISTIVPGKTPCLECFMPNFRDDSLPSCSVAGVHPSILGLIASIEVSEAIRLLIGESPVLANQLLYCDLREFSFDRVSIARHPQCPACSSNPTSASSIPHRKFIEETCSRSGKRTHIITPRTNLDISVSKLVELLQNQQLKTLAEGRLGLTFNYRPNISVSLLKSGIMVSEGAFSKEEALNIYRRFIIDGLGIAQTQVE